jgi:hypothetical protein
LRVYLLMTYPISKAFTVFIIITFHSPPTTSHPIYHSEEWRWSINYKKKESCFNLTVISNIFLKASTTISTTLLFGRLTQPKLGQDNPV